MHSLLVSTWRCAESVSPPRGRSDFHCSTADHECARSWCKGRLMKVEMEIGDSSSSQLAPIRFSDAHRERDRASTTGRGPSRPRKGSRSTLTSEDLDPALWQWLPEDMFLEIVARLAPSAICRFKSVSPQWRTFTRDGAFLKIYRQVRGCLDSCFLILHDYNRRLRTCYLERSGKWFDLPMSYLPPGACRLYSSDGGLVCIGAFRNSSNLSICNPITGAVRVLDLADCEDTLKQLSISTETVQLQEVLVNLVVNRSTKAYQVVVVLTPRQTFQSSRPRVSLVYESSSKRWRAYESSANLGGFYLSANAAVRNGVMYWLTSSPDGLATFNIDSGDWLHIQLPMPDKFVPYPGSYLFHFNNQVIMVGLKVAVSPFTIGVWRLNEESDSVAVWECIGYVPSKLSTELMAHANGRAWKGFQCFGSDGLITVVAWGAPRWITYDVSDNVWGWAEPTPVADMPEATQSCLLHDCVAYGPTFDIDP